MDELSAPEFIEQARRAVEELKATGRTTSYKNSTFKADGTRRWALSRPPD